MRLKPGRKSEERARELAGDPGLRRFREALVDVRAGRFLDQPRMVEVLDEFAAQDLDSRVEMRAAAVEAAREGGRPAEYSRRRLRNRPQASDMLQLLANGELPPSSGDATLLLGDMSFEISRLSRRIRT